MEPFQNGGHFKLPRINLMRPGSNRVKREYTLKETAKAKHNQSQTFLRSSLHELPEKRFVQSLRTY